MKALSELMLGKISNKAFLKANNIMQIESFIKQGLNESFKSKSATAIEQYIYLIFRFEVYSKEYVDILNKLLISSWHYQHENIAILLEKISALSSIPYLYDAIDLHPQYLTLENSHAFEIKCVRSIYYIGRESSLPYLKKLCTHSIPEVREMAQQQIMKLL